MTPRQRKAYAFHALREAGYATISTQGDDLEDAVVDLITDLLHFAKARKFDAARIIKRAESHLEEEKG